MYNLKSHIIPHPYLTKHVFNLIDFTKSLNKDLYLRGLIEESKTVLFENFESMTNQFSSSDFSLVLNFFKKENLYKTSQNKSSALSHLEMLLASKGKKEAASLAKIIEKEIEDNIFKLTSPENNLQALLCQINSTPNSELQFLKNDELISILLENKILNPAINKLIALDFCNYGTGKEINFDIRDEKNQSAPYDRLFKHFESGLVPSVGLMREFTRSAKTFEEFKNICKKFLDHFGEKFYARDYYSLPNINIYRDLKEMFSMYSHSNYQGYDINADGDYGNYHIKKIIQEKLHLADLGFDISNFNINAYKTLNCFSYEISEKPEILSTYLQLGMKVEKFDFLSHYGFGYKLEQTKQCFAIYLDQNPNDNINNPFIDKEVEKVKQFVPQEVIENAFETTYLDIDSNIPNGDRNITFGQFMLTLADQDLFNTLISAGLNPSYVDWNYRTLLHYSQNFEVSKSLIEKFGLDMKAKDINGNSILMQFEFKQLSVMDRDELKSFINYFKEIIFEKNNYGYSFYDQSLTYSDHYLVSQLDSLAENREEGSFKYQLFNAFKVSAFKSTQLNKEFIFSRMLEKSGIKSSPSTSLDDLQKDSNLQKFFECYFEKTAKKLVKSYPMQNPDSKTIESIKEVLSHGLEHSFSKDQINNTNLFDGLKVFEVFNSDQEVKYFFFNWIFKNIESDFFEYSLAANDFLMPYVKNLEESQTFYFSPAHFTAHSSFDEIFKFGINAKNYYRFEDHSTNFLSIGIDTHWNLKSMASKEKYVSPLMPKINYFIHNMVHSYYIQNPKINTFNLELNLTTNDKIRCFGSYNPFSANDINPNNIKFLITYKNFEIDSIIRNPFTTSELEASNQNSNSATSFEHDFQTKYCSAEDKDFFEHSRDFSSYDNIEDFKSRFTYYDFIRNALEAEKIIDSYYE